MCEKWNSPISYAPAWIQQSRFYPAPLKVRSYRNTSINVDSCACCFIFYWTIRGQEETGLVESRNTNICCLQICLFVGRWEGKALYVWNGWSDHVQFSQHFLHVPAEVGPDWAGMRHQLLCHAVLEQCLHNLVRSLLWLSAPVPRFSKSYCTKCRQKTSLLSTFAN